MTQVDIIRNGIIDRLLSISDKNYLLAIRKIVDNSLAESDSIKFTDEQKLMLEMSELDIKMGNVISQIDLDKSDLEWLKGK